MGGIGSGRRPTSDLLMDIATMSNDNYQAHTDTVHKLRYLWRTVHAVMVMLDALQRQVEQAQSRDKVIYRMATRQAVPA